MYGKDLTTRVAPRGPVFDIGPWQQCIDNANERWDDCKSNVHELFWKQIAACRLIEDSGEELKCVNAAADKISDGMRICRTCGLEKEEEEFHKGGKNPGGRSSSCGVCKNEYYKSWYKKNRKKQITATTKRYHKYSKEFEELKAELVCEKCGFDNTLALDFHHRDPKEKDMALADAKGHWSLHKIRKEIEKCEVLCANCHRIKHHEIHAGRARAAAQHSPKVKCPGSSPGSRA